MKEREIRANYDDDTIVVYQAYSEDIALAAIENQKFVYPFKMNRMTWIKPSFLWMMYRSGWATKAGQEHILAIKIKRKGFEWALEKSCLSTYKEDIYGTQDNWREILTNAPVRIQWDPEKNLTLDNVNYKSIQIGLKGLAVEKYVNDWIVQIDDITPYSKEIYKFILENNIEKAEEMLPVEKTYPLTKDIQYIVDCQ